MENNQTAIDWLEDNLIGNPHSEEDFKHNINIWGQSKQMEKEQIIAAIGKGWQYCEDGKVKWMGEQYYNETYNKQDNGK